MSLYLTKQTPIPQDKPPHMPTMPQLWTCSTGPVGTNPGPEHPKSRCKRKSPLFFFSLVPSMELSHHSRETPQLDDLLVDTQDIHATETLFFNQPCNLLQQSPLTLIMEQSHTMGFALTSLSTPFLSLNLTAYPEGPPVCS